MRRFFIAAALAALCYLPTAGAQGDQCRGALSALNRVKEEIRPSLSAQTEFGRSRLSVMQSTLERSTSVCKNRPELWYYEMVVSQRLGKTKDAAYAKGQVEALQYESQFDPFALPETASPPPAPSGKVRQKWAVVVGIDSFEDKRIPTLHYSSKDATDFVDYLKDPQGGRFNPSHIELLENEKATLEGISEAIGKLRVNAQPDDLVVLYFSGHGTARDRDPNGMSYILTHDTNIENPEKLYATSLQMINLVQTLNYQVKSRHVVLILDTCFSGDALTGIGASADESGSRGLTAVWPSEPPPDAPASVAFSAALQNFKIGYGRAVITASRADESSFESPQLKNGYFTHYLLDELRKSHGNRSLDSIFPQVRAAVSAKVKAEQRANQNPSFEFSENAASLVLDVQESM